MPSTLLTLAIVAASSLPVQPYRYFESPRAYEIAAHVAIASLPDELRPTFEALRTTIADAATDKLVDAGDATIHVCPLDGGADNPGPKQRRAYVQRIFQLIKKADDEGYLARISASWTNTLPGRLWRAERSLVDSFKSRDKGDITRDAGAVLHFALDAAMPFNATHKKWCESLWTAADDKQNVTSQSPRHRYHVVLVDRLAERFAYEARVAPQRIHALRDFSRAVFATVAAAHESALTLEQIERDLRADGRFGDSSKAGDKDAAFQDLLVERAAPILEAQIEAGALLGAGLILTAWIEAGRPELTILAAAPPPVPTPAPPTSPSVPTAAGSAPPVTVAVFFGSRSSKIFHRANCSHAERIKSDNRVYFDTAAQARARGREPCKSCKPD